MESYEKKYKEALELARVAAFNGHQSLMEGIFPELKESEDERIRKEIIDFIDTKTIDSDERRNRWFSYLEKYKPISFTSLEDTKVKMSLMQYISELNQDVVHLHPGIETCNEWIAWLEKQDKQPSAIRWYDVSLIPQEMEELLVEWDSEDATWHEIAFYHADTKTFWDGTRQVENVTRWCYIIDLLEKQGESSDKIHYWTEEEIEPIISDYLRGAEHYGGMIGRLRCLKPKSLEKQGDSPIKWNKNTEGNKPEVNHSVLMKTTQGIAEGEWKGEYWEQYRWAGIVRDSDVLSWMELSSLEKQGEQKPTLRERYKNIAESEWFKKTHDGMSVSDDEKVDNVNKIEQKPVWGEEDERMCQETIDWFEKKCFPYAIENENPARESIKWLQSLKQRIGG